MDKDISYRTFMQLNYVFIRQFASDTHLDFVVIGKILNNLSKLTYCLNFVYSHNLSQLKAPKRILRGTTIIY